MTTKARSRSPRLVRALVGLAFAVLLATTPSCARLGWERESLYEQLGEREGIDRLVDTLLLEIAADARIVEHFRGVDVGRFREQLTLHLCQLSDGPCRYQGAPIAEVHRGMEIRQGDFNALVEDLIHAMESLHIPTGTQNRLLARLAPLRGDVVEDRWERR